MSCEELACLQGVSGFDKAGADVTPCEALGLIPIYTTIGVLMEQKIMIAA